MKLILEIIIMTIFMLVALCLGILIGTIADGNYDYKINLDYNKIEVYRIDEGDVITIHPDSLNSFIIKDNL